MEKVSAFLGAGGNQVFFVSGVLQVLREQNIHIDHFYCFSASASIVFGYLHNCSKEITHMFAKNLNTNSQNFYLTKKPHFPHTNIYRGAIIELFSRHGHKKIESSYTLVAGATKPSFRHIKGFVSGLCLLPRAMFSKTPLGYARKLLGIKPIFLESSENPTNKELITFILGSSAIYPFIEICEYKDKLLLDGVFVEPSPKLLNGFKKRIAILTNKGPTQIEDGVLFIRPKKKITNIVNYTSGDDVIHNYKFGIACALENLDLIKSYLEK